MDAIIKYFKLESKAKTIITDNGSNFVKAFATFQTKKELAEFSDSEYETDTDIEEPFDYSNPLVMESSLSEASDSSVAGNVAIEEHGLSTGQQPSAGDILDAYTAPPVRQQDHDNSDNSGSSSEEEREVPPKITLPIHFRYLIY